MKRLLTIAAILAASSASAQQVPANQVAINTNACGAGTIISANYINPTTVRVVCQVPGGAVEFGGLTAAGAAAAAVVLIAVVAASDGDSDSTATTTTTTTTTN